MIDYFSDLKIRGEAAIDDWIESEVPEGIFLDCKRKENAGKPDLDSNDRRALGKTLSALANSEGGVLIWGVDAREVEGVDKLTTKTPIRNLRAFRSRVDHAIAELISPPIPDIEVLEIPARDDPDIGFLAIQVPCSERRPHMSRENKDRGFYFRYGHRSVPMEESQIRDQMLRKSKASLTVTWQVRVLAEDARRIREPQWEVPVALDLIIENQSAASARAPFLRITSDRGIYRSMGPDHLAMAEHGLSLTRSGPLHERHTAPERGSQTDLWEFSADADYCIHPGMSLRVATIRVGAPGAAHHYPNGQAGIPGTAHTEVTPNYGGLPTIGISVSVACLDAEIATQMLWLDPVTMSQAIAETLQTGPIYRPYRP